MTLWIGIDIGNQKCVVGVHRNGIVDAVLNEESKRETPTVVQFARDHRLFGGSCDRMRDPPSTIDQLKCLIIGLGIVLTFDAARGRDGSFSVQVEYLTKTRQFTAVQILAMLLLHIKRTAECTVGSKITACVIGIPPYLNARQRKAYLHAAAIAGFGPCELIEDGLATAIEYGSNRMTNTAIDVVFVDIGHCDTQVTVVRFVGENPKVLGRSWKENLGGRDFDDVIRTYCFEELTRQHEGYVKLTPKAEVKLMAACEKAKKVLSVNRDAHISVDSLMGGDSEFKVVITREDFQRRSGELLDMIEAVCREALSKSGLRMDDIHSIELVGSGTRIPAISGVLSRFFGRQLSRTLNGSECVARGCALKCEAIKKNKLAYFWIWLKYLFQIRCNTSISDAQGVEKELLIQDRTYRQASFARNKLETNLWRIRNELKTEGRFAEILEKINEIESWIYDEKADESAEIYMKEIESINKLLEENELSHLKIESYNQQEFEEEIENELLDPREHGCGPTKMCSLIRWGCTIGSITVIGLLVYAVSRFHK